MVINLEQLEQCRASLPQPVGLCLGCFDLVHSGHIEHFLLSRQQCNTLIVSVTPDQYVFKGPGRPYFNQKDRARIIDAIRCVDYVLCDNWENDRTGMTAIRHIKPDMFFKGSEYALVSKKPGTDICDEVSLVESFGGKTRFVSGKIFSSTKILSELEVKK